VDRVRRSKSSSEGFAYVGKIHTKFILISAWELLALQEICLAFTRLDVYTIIIADWSSNSVYSVLLFIFVSVILIIQCVRKVAVHLGYGTYYTANKYIDKLVCIGYIDVIFITWRLHVSAVLPSSGLYKIR
jgi:hypothetical protein